MPPKAENAGRATEALNSIQLALLEGEVIESIRLVYDPEIPVNVYDLGLVYDVQVGPDASVVVTMTLTSPACPVADTLPAEVEERVRATPGVREAKVNLTWDPPFSIDRIPDHVKLELGLL
jgi:FeS assembly SUF system protein